MGETIEHDLASMEIESKEDVKFICGQIGHLHKEGRKITVTVTELRDDTELRGNEDADQ